MRFRVIALIVAILLVGCKPEPDVIETAEKTTEKIEVTETSSPTVEISSTDSPTEAPRDTPEPTSTPTVEVVTIDTQVSDLDQMVMVFVPTGDRKSVV